jgi:vacuolar-type H+-ATPase subunit H
MEGVWEELKKIEAQAEQIRVDAQNKAKNITVLAGQEAEKLVASGKTLAEEEAQQLYANAVQQANSIRDEKLKASQKVAEKLRLQAEKHMDQAVSKVVNSVLEEKP